MNIHQVSPEQIERLCQLLNRCCERIMAGGPEADAMLTLLDRQTWVVIDSDDHPPRPQVCLLQHRPVASQPLIRPFRHTIGFGGDLRQVMASVGDAAGMRALLGKMLERADEFFLTPVAPGEKLYPPALPG